MFTRMQALNPTYRFRNEMQRLLDTFAEEAGRVGLGSSPSFPALNVWEDQDCLFAEAETPGLTMDELELTVTGNELTIRGQRSSPPAEGVSYHRRERGTGSFSRVVRFPTDIDADRVTADLRDGVLLIRLPKAEAARPRKIEVHTA